MLNKNIPESYLINEHSSDELDNRIITVIDSEGQIHNPTYLRRAKGFVKNGRAEWVNESTIQLFCSPLVETEGFITLKDFFTEQSDIENFTPYNNKYKYRFDIVKLPESLKFAGVSVSKSEISWGYKAKTRYQKKYKPLIKYKHGLNLEIGLWENITSENGEFKFLYGCVVNSLNDLPDGVIGADTGFNDFLVMTVQNNAESNQKPHAIRLGHFGFGELMPVEYKDKIIHEHVSRIEIYSLLYDYTEMYFLSPLKNN